MRQFVIGAELAGCLVVCGCAPLVVDYDYDTTFDFAKLAQSAGSPTLKSQNLTVQMVSQPAWYAVMALPYLMEFPHECTEQTFNRL